MTIDQQIKQARECVVKAHRNLKEASLSTDEAFAELYEAVHAWVSLIVKNKTFNPVERVE